MYSLRKWMFKPKRTDTSLLAQFFYSDEELNMVATELDSFDGRKDPERCSALVNQLRACQDKVLTIVEKIMEEALPSNRANRDFRVKFPDDVLQESLAGQLWFGAECLAAGSSIMNREVESTSMRPLAKSLTRHLDYLRSILRDQCLRNSATYTDKILEALRVFDRLFAEFELRCHGAEYAVASAATMMVEMSLDGANVTRVRYVSAMVPVKTMKEYDTLQDVIVLFSETTQRALRLNLLTQDMLDDYDPALMFTIPRLAIVCGLLIYPEGPVNPDMDPMVMSDMFRPFQTLLYKIRELLWTLSRDELWLLEKALCSAEEPGQYRKIEQVTFDEERDVHNQDTQTDFPIFDPNGNNPGGQHYLLEPDYNFCMTQSPSTVTIVANPNYKGNEDGATTAATEQPTLLQLATSGAEGATSGDSGSSDSEAGPSPQHRHFFNGLGQETRTLRHSLSWPESTRRPRLSTSFSDGDGATADCSIMDDDGVPRAMVTQRNSTHEFSFHLPINTELNSTYTAMANSLQDISTQDVESKPSALQRIFITSDSHDGIECDDGMQISYVTETLNEVFVTDTTFRGMADNLKHLTRNCSKCKDCSCHINDESEQQKHSSDLESSIEGVNARTLSTIENVFEGSDSSEVIAKEDIASGNGNSSSACERCQKCRASGDPAGPEGNADSDDKKAPSLPGHSECRCRPSGSTSSPVRQKCKCSQAGGSSSAKCQCSSPEEAPVCTCGESKARAQEACNTNDDDRASRQRETLEVPALRRVKYSESGGSSTCSSRSASPSVHSIEYDWDRASYASSDTSSYDSDCHDDEEITMAIKAAEWAARQEARARFKSSSDLIHRLFVCISGVADQLQTNYASDLRHILKCVFECNASDIYVVLPPAQNSATQVEAQDTNVEGSSVDASDLTSGGRTSQPPSPAREALSSVSTRATNNTPEGGPAPTWIPDNQTDSCTSCKIPFTFVRRRHHCRNCGKIFCGRCSSNFVPLPHYGHTKPVRVCSHCFMFQVTPFTMAGDSAD